MKKSLTSASNSRRRARAGGLLWWTFRNAATRPDKLAQTAIESGLPPIFLPVPFPIDPRVALQRALQRATVKVPSNIGGTWRADPLTELPNVNGPLRQWTSKLNGTDGFRFGIVQSWHPRAGNGPWVVRLWIMLDPSTKELHMLPAPGTPSRGVDAMMRRVKRMFREELQSAGAPEIGDGVLEALKHARGVKLRAGLWALPGEPGIKLVQSLKKYLDNIGHTSAGTLILPQSKRSNESDAGSLVEMGLRERAEDLIAEIRNTDLKNIGTGKLRTLWDRLQFMHARFEANEELIGRRAANSLRARMKPSERSLRQAARAKKVTLDRTAGRSTIDYLRSGIHAVYNSARKGDVAGLATAERLLVRGQTAAWPLGIPYLVARLRKLTRGAIEVNKKTYFDALQRAATYVEKQARKKEVPGHAHG